MSCQRMKRAERQCEVVEKKIKNKKWKKERKSKIDTRDDRG
jgi:hypothetical protein